MKSLKMLLLVAASISLSCMMKMVAESKDKRQMETDLFHLLSGTCHMLPRSDFNEIKNKTFDAFVGSSLTIKEQSEVLNKIDIYSPQSKRHINCNELVADILMLQEDYEDAVNKGFGDLTMLQLMQKIESIIE